MKKKLKIRTSAKRRAYNRRQFNPSKYEIPILQTREFITDIKNKFAFDEFNRRNILDLNYGYIDEFLDKTWPASLENSEYVKNVLRQWISSMFQTRLGYYYRIPRNEYLLLIEKEKRLEKRFESIVNDLETADGFFESGYTRPSAKQYKRTIYIN